MQTEERSPSSPRRSHSADNRNPPHADEDLSLEKPSHIPRTHSDSRLEGPSERDASPSPTTSRSSGSFLTAKGITSLLRPKSGSIGLNRHDSSTGSSPGRSRQSSGPRSVVSSSETNNNAFSAVSALKRFWVKRETAPHNASDATAVQQTFNEIRKSCFLQAVRARPSDLNLEMFVQFLIVGASPKRVARKLLEPALARAPPASIVALPEVQFQFTDLEIPQTVANFCFPKGIRVVRHSAQETQQFVYSLGYLQSDRNSYCFVLTSSTNTLMYGLCVRKMEVIDDFPSFVSPPDLTKQERAVLHKRGHFIAPRCYCVLTHHPFISLHFDFLYSILSVEHLHTMEHVAAMIRKFGLSTDAVKAKQVDSDEEDSAAVVIDERPGRRLSFTSALPMKMESVDQKNIRSKSTRHQKVFGKFDLLRSENSNSKTSSMESFSSSGLADGSVKQASSASLEFGDEDSNEKSRNVDPAGVLEIIRRYKDTKVPEPGEALQFQVHIDARPSVLSFACPLEDVEARLMSNWTISALFHFMSLGNVLKLMSFVLVEKSIVFVSSEVGRLSAAVLAMIPLLRPFVWQSLFVPLLPDNMHMFLDAPVPFIVGMSEAIDKVLTSSRVVVVYIDEDRLHYNKADLRPLPDQPKLMNDLNQISIVLRNAFSSSSPLHITNSTQDATANALLGRFNSYLTNLTENLKACSITEVDKNQKQASLVLKSAFLGTFPPTAHPFISSFLETQMFATRADDVLGSVKIL